MTGFRYAMINLKSIWVFQAIGICVYQLYCVLSVLDFTIKMKRRPGFYVTYLFVPSVTIIGSSMFSFYLSPGSDAKVDLAVTGLLSQTVFLLLISDLMPPDSHNPPVLGM